MAEAPSAGPSGSLTGGRGFRRALTGTPLSRQHEVRLHGRRGRAKRIPFHRFDREAYPAAALSLAHDTYQQLATGEYDAVDGFSRLTASLCWHGAPFDLIAASAQIPADEIRHAETAVRMAALCAGVDPSEVALDAERRLAGRPREVRMSLAQLDDVMLRSVAIGETLAAAILATSIDGATDEVAKKVLESLIADEIRHARLGWYYLAWRAPQWKPAERRAVAASAVRDVSRMEVRFASGRDAPRGSRKAARALGVLDTARQRAAIHEVMEDQIVPGLDALGLGASAAWKTRSRAPT